jgi:hypothetical protein
VHHTNSSSSSSTLLEVEGCQVCVCVCVCLRGGGWVAGCVVVGCAWVAARLLQHNACDAHMQRTGGGGGGCRCSA